MIECVVCMFCDRADVPHPGKTAHRLGSAYRVWVGSSVRKRLVGFACEPCVDRREQRMKEVIARG